MAWFPLLGSGPQWSWLVVRESVECSERWWYHVLYVYSHLHTGKFCMGHTWYLAADMQLHIFGVLLLLLLMRYRRATVPVLMVIVVASAVASGLVVYFYNLTPIVTAQTPEVLRTMFAGSQILSLVYLPFWMNLPGYIGGIATAFILHHNSNNGSIKLKDNKLLFAMLWSGVGSISCRLSYCVFLIHFIVLRLTLAGNTQLGHASLLSMISLLITCSALSYVAAVPICLLVELPLIQLWKAVTEGEPYRPQSPEQQNRKVFDLVSQLRRRIEA